MELPKDDIISDTFRNQLTSLKTKIKQ